MQPPVQDSGCTSAAAGANFIMLGTGVRFPMRAIALGFWLPMMVAAIPATPSAPCFALSSSRRAFAPSFTSTGGECEPMLSRLRGGGRNKPADAPPGAGAGSMLLRISTMLSMYGALCAGEHWLATHVLAKHLPALFGPSPLLGNVPAAFGLVILINVVGSSFMMMYLSFIPGGARRKFMELAKKKGDRDAEARYSHPKLYAEGFSQEAKAFNCHQRAHQQALETYPNFVVCSIIGGIRHPLLTSLAGLLYIVARVKWAKGYATGDPMNRYRASGGWGRHIWTSLLFSFVCAASTGLGVAGII